MKKSFYRDIRFWFLLLILIFLFDWVPFICVASFLGSRAGGLKHNQIDATAEGYIQNTNLFGCHYELCWTPLLYSSPDRPRLKFIEFEIKDFSPNDSKEKQQRAADYSGIPAEGNGWYRVQLEKRPIDDCPLLIKKRRELGRYAVREGNAAYEREIRLLAVFGERQICPYVRKVDEPKSRYLEKSSTDSVLYRDGVHMIYKSDLGYGIDRKTQQPLFQYINYTGSGTWLQPCRGGPSDGCGDLSPGVVAPKFQVSQLPANGILDVLGFKNSQPFDIDTVTVEGK